MLSSAILMEYIEYLAPSCLRCFAGSRVFPTNVCLRREYPCPMDNEPVVDPNAAAERGREAAERRRETAELYRRQREEGRGIGETLRDRGEEIREDGEGG